MLNKLTLAILLAIAAHVTSVHAEDSVIDASPMFSFDGFGTLGVVHSSENKADFRSTVFKVKGPGYSQRWSGDVDSVIGTQITADFTPQLKAVVQIVSEQNSEGSYRPMIEWANIKYQFTPDFGVRIGRSVSPAFLYSENRKVGYTTIWVRPPPEVYRLLPVTNGDGIDLSYRQHWGDWTNTLQLYSTRKDLPSQGKSRNNFQFADSTEVGALTTRLTYSKTHLTIAGLNGLFDAFRQFGPRGVEIADQYGFHNKPITVVSAGANYDPGNWFVLTEWGHVFSPSAIGNVIGWYVSSGYRYGTFTPYVTYAQSKAKRLSDPGLNVAALPPFLAGPATGLNGALNGFLSSTPVASTLTVGGRWDFTTHAALKLQFDHTRNGAGSAGHLFNAQPGFQLGGKVNLFSATIDFVF